MSLSEKINSVRKEFLAEFNLVNDDLTKNEFLKNKYLSRKGIIAELFNLISEVSDKKKPKIGKKLNVLKKDLTRFINENEDYLNAKKNDKKINIDLIDLTTEEGFSWLRENLMSENVEIFNSKKEFSEDIKLNVFKLIEQGASITKGELFKYFDKLIG